MEAGEHPPPTGRRRAARGGRGGEVVGGRLVGGRCLLVQPEATGSLIDQSVVPLRDGFTLPTGYVAVVLPLSSSQRPRSRPTDPSVAHIRPQLFVDVGGAVAQCLPCSHSTDLKQRGELFSLILEYSIRFARHQVSLILSH